MNSYLFFIDEFLIPAFSQLDTIRILCFVSSCAERMIPLIAIWNEEVASSVSGSIELGWSHTLENSLAFSDTPRLETFYRIYEQMLSVDPQDYSDIHLLAENALRSCTSFIEYAQSQLPDEARRCSEYNFAVVKALSEMLILETQMFYTEVDILENKIFNFEVKKQDSDLKVLTTYDLNIETIQKIRTESQELGRNFAQIYQDYRLRMLNGVS